MFESYNDEKEKKMELELPYTFMSFSKILINIQGKHHLHNFSAGVFWNISHLPPSSLAMSILKITLS